MKRTSFVYAFFSFFLIAVLTLSCANDKGNKEADEKLGKMEVVIPEELEDNPEMVEYIEGMTEVVDAYALMMDEMIGKLGDFKGKEFDDLNMREKIKFTAIATEVSAKSAPILAKWADYELERESFYDDELTNEEILAFETVWERFEDRLIQIQEKNAEFFEESSE